MTMSTQTLTEASRQLAAAVLKDSIQLITIGDPVTVGINVTRAQTPVGDPIPGLVQTTVLENAVESTVGGTYSIKVARGTALKPGQAVKIVTCQAEPELVGKVLLVSKVSLNGLAMIRKAVANDFEVVNQEGKEGL